MASEIASRDGGRWIKARRSSNGTECVEMRRRGEDVQVRDSKHIDGGVLALSPAQFSAWVAAARRGECDPRARGRGAA